MAGARGGLGLLCSAEQGGEAAMLLSKGRLCWPARGGARHGARGLLFLLPRVHRGGGRRPAVAWAAAGSRVGARRLDGEVMMVMEVVSAGGGHGPWPGAAGFGDLGE